MSEIWVCSRWNAAPKDEEKWKVDGAVEDSPIEWFVRSRDGHTHHYLPKSDYLPCPAPEQWERVEVALSAVDGLRFRDIIVEGDLAGIVRLHDGYRVVSLVVERRKS